MDKVSYILDINENEHALIDHGNGEYTSMLKSTYDEQQAQQVEHLAESVTKAK